MVIGTDIKNGMILAVVPADEFVILLDKREETVLMFTSLFTTTHLCQKPRTTDDCMGLQQFKTRRSLHLTGNDGGEILLDGQFIDGRNLVGLYHKSQGT